MAVMYVPHPDFPTVGGYLQRALAKYCTADQYQAGSEPPGYDHYFYIDDSPTHYMEPKYRPASYWAIDMVIPKLWFLQDASVYLERMRAFDFCFVSSTAALAYCQEHGLEASFLGFACDPEYHRPHELERDLDWIAAWHNCGDRIEASNQAALHYPNGRVGYFCWHDYAEQISRSRCVLNWLRGNLVNMRVFEAMAIGTPLITTRNADMDFFGFSEGRHYLGIDNIDDMLLQIGWVRDNPEQAAQIAARARRSVLARHTYDHRAQDVFAVIDKERVYGNQ